MIIHFTTVHPRHDVRIRNKQVTALQDTYPGNVTLYVQDGLGNEFDPAGFEIVDTGPRPKGRLRRMTVGAWRMFKAVYKARPEVAHFHDPELLPWAIILRTFGIKVVYDVHEDLPRQILHKDYFSKPVARVLSAIAETVERAATPFMSAIIVVVPAMLRRFPAQKTFLIANFPILDEAPSNVDQSNKEPRFVYAGGITEPRGALNMMKSINLVEHPEATLALLGNFVPASLADKLSKMPGWSKTDSFGWSDRQTVQKEYARASAGLVLLEPTPQYLISYPVKMFEYMAAGLPIIASNFPLWKEIVEDAGCGLTVDPKDPKGIADAMQYMLDNPAHALEMGKRGRKAAEEKYNWDAEKATLDALYARILAKT